MKTEFAPALLQDPETAASAAEIRRCVRCGFCTATCPTYVLLGDELDSPRGRIYLMKDMLEHQRAPEPEVVKHIDRCLSCLACKTTCPSGVDYMQLIDHARSYIEQRYRRPWPDRMYRRLLAAVLPHRARFRAALALGRLARPLAPWQRRSRTLAPAAAMLALAPARATRRERTAPPTISGERKGRVVVLEGCAEPVLKPEIRAATLRLLARMGVEVVEPPPGETCCGALTLHLGRDDIARDNARRNVEAWSRLIDEGGLDAIVVTAAGCGTSVKAYGHLLRDDPAYSMRASKVSALAKDISECLAHFGLPPASAPPGLTVAYQAACSLQHGQGVRALPAELLAQAGFVVKQPAEPHLCCGSAGTYNILQPEIAGRLRARKLDNLDRLRPEVIASGNIGCISQLTRSDGVPVVHTVELLDWATGGPRPAALTR